MNRINSPLNQSLHRLPITRKVTTSRTWKHPNVTPRMCHEWKDGRGGRQRILLEEGLGEALSGFGARCTMRSIGWYVCDHKLAPFATPLQSKLKSGGHRRRLDNRTKHFNVRYTRQALQAARTRVSNWRSGLASPLPHEAPRPQVAPRGPGRRALALQAL